MAREKPIPVYIVRRTSPVTIGCGVIILVFLMGTLIQNCSYEPEPVVASTDPDPAPDVVQTPAPPFMTPKVIEIAPMPTTPTPSQAELIAKQRQAQMAANYKKYYDFYTSQSQSLTRPKDKPELEKTLRQREQAYKAYNMTISPEFYQKLVAEEVAKEQKRLEKQRLAAEKAILRQKGIEDGRQWRAYNDGFDAGYDGAE